MNWSVNPNCIPKRKMTVLVINKDWQLEVKQTVERAFDEQHDVDIAALELNTLKMAMNITFADLRQVVVPSMMARIDPTKPQGIKPVF
jgi:hypothetical protein